MAFNLKLSREKLTKLDQKSVLLAISLFIAILVFFKNAWVTEDAFILFRSLEQLFAGNGPTWNPHERVQIFTSPLWFWIQAFVRIFSDQVYYNVIAISFVLWVSTVFVLRKVFKSYTLLLASILLFTASTAFFDYTSSGLENGLLYFFIALYLNNYLSLYLSTNRTNSEEEKAVRNRITAVFFIFGLVICTRHDLLLLLLPPTLYVFFSRYQHFSKRQWILLASAALTPFILWSLFSLFYYGFPFPNTAYAKLNTGIPKQDLILQGLKYFYTSLRFDLITLIVISTFLITSFVSRSGKHTKFLAFGVILNLMYVVYVGGDFMQGRFLSYAYMVSVVLLLLNSKSLSLHLKQALGGLLVLYLFLYPHTPFNSPFNYQNSKPEEAVFLGVADERGFYFNDLSIFNYPKFVRQTPSVQSSFAQIWKASALDFKNSSDTIRPYGNIGIYGYWLGTEKIVVDTAALSEPLLARMPIAPGPWRVGHYGRIIPEGYIESIQTDSEIIKDPQINEFYSHLKLVTQSDDLFAWERIKTILLFNLGHYDHLVESINDQQ